MIELLIVVAVLGILAVAVLAAINPIEQINRGRDTGSRSDAEQLLSAIDRFYVSHQYYPWEDPNAVPREAEVNPIQLVNDEWMSANPEGRTVMSYLTSGGTAELKESFVNRIYRYPDQYKLKVFFTGNEEDSVYVCFEARSGSFKQEAKDRCGEEGRGLPLDLQDAAETVCATGHEHICLP